MVMNTNDERLLEASDLHEDLAKQAGPSQPTEKIVIQHRGNSTVFVIPPTFAEHNIMIALLQRIRNDYPGAWYCVQEWERNKFKQARIGQASPDVPDAVKVHTPKMKEVSREYLGLPKDDNMGDIPT
jgi:hypothetical protein